MKTFRMALFALALVAISMPTWANDTTPPDRINLCTKAVEAKKVVVQISNLEKKNTTLRLSNTYGDVYYREAIRNHNGHRALLDLEQLPEGRYLLTLSQKGEAKSQVIRITENNVLVSHCVN